MQEGADDHPALSSSAVLTRLVPAIERLVELRPRSPDLASERVLPVRERDPLRSSERVVGSHRCLEPLEPSGPVLERLGDRLASLSHV